MKIGIKYFFIGFVLFQLFFVDHVFAQPFIKEINAFKQQDSIAMPPKNAILFAGSSSFRLWKNMEEEIVCDHW